MRAALVVLLAAPAYGFVPVAPTPRSVTMHVAPLGHRLQWAGRPVTKSAAGMMAASSGTSEPKVGFAPEGFGIGFLMLEEAAEAFKGPAGASRLLSSIPLLCVMLAVLRVLNSAGSRGRLGGGTFRVLALGLLAASSVILFDAAFSGVGLLVGSRSYQDLLVPVALLAAAWEAWYFTTSSYGTLKAVGLPSVKTALKAETGNRALLTVLAVAYAATAVQQVVWGASLLLYTNLKLTGALRCFVVSACAHVCQTAAVAGPKRLSSDTYRTLNVVLALDSVARLAAIFQLSEMSLRWSSPALLVLPSISLLTAVGGWLVGKLYKSG